MALLDRANPYALSGRNKDYSMRFGLGAVRVCLLATALTALASASYAQVLPGAAEGSRVRPEDRIPALQKPRSVIPLETGERMAPPVSAPEGAENIRFVLKQVEIDGNTVLDDAALHATYAKDLGKEISLKTVYQIAGKITRQYREEGYLLSYAYVPDQEVAEGTVRIAVAEGYIGKVNVEGEDKNARITRQYIDRLTAERPLSERTLESTLLRLNDLPGTGYRAVLLRDPDAAPGQATLSLVPSAEKARASVGFDNFGSRYLGPNEVSATYSDSLFPLQQTTLVALTSMPTDELNYGSIAHSIVVAPDVTVEGSASLTESQPGYTLKSLEIESTTKSFGLGVNYQLIRQRNENLLLKARLEFTDVESDLLNLVPLTRDTIRVARVGASFDNSDAWDGSNVINFTLSQGIDGFGSSQEGDLNLSRAEAKPDFTKAELSISRLQSLAENWSVLAQASGQWANEPLYASEEFGVGGQNYGRAYDTSEIVGDRGASGMIELRYTGWRTIQPVNFEPFIYYDIGFVTNQDSAGQATRESLSSAGGGMRFATIWGQTGMAGLAFPLTREISAPIWGQNNDAPRVMFQLSHNF